MNRDTAGCPDHGRMFRTLLAPDFLPPAEPVAVGWSGGADSTALLLALQAAGCDVRAWHVDHAWRQGSAGEAAWLAERAAAWGIRFYSTRLDLPPSANREAEARHARYAAFLVWGREQGVEALYLGHHLEDQAETVCMRLLQGAGVPGCCGMLGERRLDSLRLLRPLLAVSKQQLCLALETAGITWIEDTSNQDVTLWRNKIRHRLFPAVQQAGFDPIQLFMRWQHQAQRVAGQLNAAAGDVTIARQDDGVTISWQAWSGTTAPLRAYLLQQMVRMVMGTAATPGRRHILLVEKWTQHGGCGGVDLSRCRLERRRGFLHLRPQLAMLR